MASVGSSTVAMIRAFSMGVARDSCTCDQQLTAPDCLCYRFLVASRAVRDLLLCAKHLFVAAMPAIARARGAGNKTVSFGVPGKPALKLTRGSIALRQTFLRRRWIAGSS